MFNDRCNNKQDRCRNNLYNASASLLFFIVVMMLMLMMVLMTVFMLVMMTVLTALVLMMVMFVYHMQFLLISAAKVLDTKCNPVAKKKVHSKERTFNKRHHKTVLSEK